LKDPFQNYTLIPIGDFPYYMSMLMKDLLKELMASPLEYASFMPRGVMADSRDIIQLDRLPAEMKKAGMWLEKNWANTEDTSDPWRFKGMDREELLLKAMRRYMSFYMECIDEWGDVIDKSIKDENPEAFAAFLEAFQIILFVRATPKTEEEKERAAMLGAVEIDLNTLYQKAIDPTTEGDGWMYVDP